MKEMFCAFGTREVLTLSTPLTDWGRHFRYEPQWSGVQRVNIKEYRQLNFGKETVVNILLG